MFGRHPICECGFTPGPSEGFKSLAMPCASALKLSLLVDRVMHSEQGTIPSVQLRESPKELKEIHRHWQSSEPQFHTLGTSLHPQWALCIGTDDCFCTSCLWCPNFQRHNPDLPSSLHVTDRPPATGLVCNT